SLLSLHDALPISCLVDRPRAAARGLPGRLLHLLPPGRAGDPAVARRDGAAVSPIRLTLPDGSVREVAEGTTSRQVAQSIGAGLARAAIAARVDGQIRDLDRPLTQDARFAILTDKDPDALEVLRHSAAHILATAVRELFPTAGIGFGPPIEDGFYYDFEV